MIYKEPKKLSIIIPVYNEQATIIQIINRVRQANILGLQREIVVVDDGSTDQTPALLKNIKTTINKIVCHSKNKGKGWAIRSGLKSITGDIVLIQDADLEYHPKEYAKLIRPILKKNAPVVYGSRELSGKNHHSYLAFHMGGRMVTALTNLLYGSNLTDVPTGYKVFRSEIIKKLPLRCCKFEFCPEVTVLLLKNGVPILEVPIKYQPRTKQQGKKIRPSDGLEAFWTIFRHRIPNIGKFKQ